jgi:hypothetical protein
MCLNNLTVHDHYPLCEFIMLRPREPNYHKEGIWILQSSLPHEFWSSVKDT